MKLINLLLIPVFLLSGHDKDAVSGLFNSQSTSVSASAQEVFSYIRCHRQAKNIVVTWGVTSTVGIDHFEVMHSDDFGDTYNLLDQVAVSGNRYSFKHESVFPGYHYYYIKAVMTSGPAVESTVDIVRIVAR